MKLALKTYGWLEATLHEEQVGLEDEESNDKEEESSDDDTDNEEENSDEDQDMDEEGNEEEDEDGEEEEEEDGDEDEEEDGEDMVEDDEEDGEEEEKGEECDCKKDDYWDFIFEARQFVAKKGLLEKYVRKAKRVMKLFNDFEKDKCDKPKNLVEVFKDVGHIIDGWKEDDVGCFGTCSKRKIHSMCNIVQILQENKSEMEKVNPSKYKNILRILGPHLNKLTGPNMSTHEKRKAMQKAQVGPKIFDAVVNLMIPALKRGKKRKRV